MKVQDILPDTIKWSKWAPPVRVNLKKGYHFRPVVDYIITIDGKVAGVIATEEDFFVGFCAADKELIEDWPKAMFEEWEQALDFVVKFENGGNVSAQPYIRGAMVICGEESHFTPCHMSNPKALKKVGEWNHGNCLVQTINAEFEDPS